MAGFAGVLLVVTDIDGTLIEESGGAWKDSSLALARLAGRGIPLVPCSSKTRVEILALRSEIGLDGPFIAENGGGLYWPGGTPGLHDRPPDEIESEILGIPYARLRTRLVEVRERLGAPLVGFGDLDDEGVRAATGLTLERAALARVREHDEPFWFASPVSDAERETVLEALRRGLPGPGGGAGLEDSDLRVEQGGRFLHLHGAADKGTAVRALRGRWSRRMRTSVRVAAIGDSPNDIPLFREADAAWLVRRSDGAWSPEVLDAVPVTRADGIGPRGFLLAIEAILGS